MNNYDKNIANGIKDRWYLQDPNADLSLDVNEYENLRDFCKDIVMRYNAPIIILPSKFSKNLEFIREILNKLPYKINELYETQFFTYQKFIKSLSNPQVFLSRCSKFKHFRLNPNIRFDLQTLISQSNTSLPVNN